MKDGPQSDDRRFTDRVRWVVRADHEAVVLRGTVGVLLVVVLIGLLLFVASGIWPPMVAVESESMAPVMHRGGLVFVAEEHRLGPSAAREGTGVVTRRTGKRTGYGAFDGYGDVVVYRPDGDENRTPIIHRAQFWVNESENWYGKADPRFVGGGDCSSVPNCPAPHAGFVTKGDHNGQYDQVGGLSSPVRPSWLRGAAEVKIPSLGSVRLALG